MSWSAARPSEYLFGKSLEDLESPFLDEEILARDAERPLDSAERDDAEETAEETADETETDEEARSEVADFEDEALAVEDEPEHEAQYEDDVEHEAAAALAAADTIDEAAAQPAFPKAVADRLEPLLDVRRARDASRWNAARHPSTSGLATGALLTRLDRYVRRSAIEAAMRNSEGLKDLAQDEPAVLAVMAHQFQQKVYASKGQWDGLIGEGTLDALGFVRHRDAALNPVDAANIAFHVTGRSKAFRRLQELYTTDRRAFEGLGADVSPATWYSLFVNAPFLGWPFVRGVHVELMRRLRRAETWLLAQRDYRGMSPVQLGAALGIDERHRGGRATNNNSMHTLGLAVDIRYIKNPWVAGQHGKDGKPNRNRNAAFMAVSRRVAWLMTGGDDAVTPQWLKSLGADRSGGTAAAHTAIEQRHANWVRYFALETDRDRLRAAIEQRRQDAKPDRVIKPGETVDAAVERWRSVIGKDRKDLREPFAPGRDPAAGYMNLHRDLVIALRDHGCLAWGGIDLGATSSGDMMHFDCRAAGIGWKLSLEKQRTAGAGHPCVARTETETLEELETPSSTPAPSSVAGFRGGRLWTFTATTLPMQVAVFCPKAVTSPKTLEVLLYAHGHLAPCPPVPKTMPGGMITHAPFELGKIVDASNRPLALIVPFMDWSNLKKNKLNYEACNRDTMHALGTPTMLNGVLREALAEIGRMYGTATPAVQSLILAGHSRAYDFFNPLALAHVDPEMSKGSLAALSKVWVLDATYVCYIAEWMRWLSAKPGLEVSVFYRPGSGTAECGRKLEAVAGKSGGRLTVTRVSEGHCQVPRRRLPGLLNPSAPPIAPEIGEEIDEALDEALDEEIDDERDEAMGEEAWDPEAAEADETSEDAEVSSAGNCGEI